VTDAILVINAGSSSLKFALYGDLEARAPAARFRGQVDGIGARPRLRVRDEDDSVSVDRLLDAGLVADHGAALAEVVTWLRSLPERVRLASVGHRVVHGGVEFSSPVIVDEEILGKLERLTPLAPLHQPANLAPIRAGLARLPDIPQVACFDSAFHRTHPPLADHFALPRELYEAGVRRYGFHGLSYECIVGKLKEAAPDMAKGRVVVAHLGSGASLCAMKGGVSVDTTMSFTGLDGLPMGTRSGSVDPAVVIFLIRDMGMTPNQVEDLLYRKSGLLGLSGESNDVRDLTASKKSDARFALDYFVYRVCQSLGSMAATLEGLDGVVFTAGIGQYAAEIRGRICAKSAWLGLELDETANRAGGPRITTARSPVPAWVIPTDEEIVIATHARDIVGGRVEATATTH
jgi:acetate kinase